MAIAVAVLTVGVGVALGAQADAATPGVAQVAAAATALKPAVRLSHVGVGQTGVIIFPMNPTPRCEMIRTSFGQPRSGGRIHEGLDIMATLGQEIYAVDTGTLSQQTVDGGPNSALSGNAWRLKMADGTYYYYGHLSAFASGLKQGDTVAKGQLIGYVGDTGNPGPGNYHLHFEIHPLGGAAVDPLPLLTVPSTCKIYG
jgi:murein DD-endopeptidase MepM/ murein hydrolase activator NlpD